MSNTIFEWDISQLKYFLYVAKFENMSQAAQYLHVSQPSISRARQSLDMIKINALSAENILKDVIA